MSDQAELDREDGVADEPSTGEVRVADSQESSRQTKQANLDDDPRFQSWKSTMDRQLSAKEYAVQEAERRAQQAQYQAEQLYLQTLDEQGKIQFILNKKDEEIALLRQQRENDARFAQWRLNMEEVHKETGIPYDQLADTLNFPDPSYVAWQRGNKYLKEQRDGGKRRAVDEDEAPQVDDRVDVSGGGKPPSARTRYQQEYDKALDQADWIGMQTARDKAARAGVRLTDKQGREMN